MNPHVLLQERSTRFYILKNLYLNSYYFFHKDLILKTKLILIFLIYITKKPIINQYNNDHFRLEKIEVKIVEK